MSTMNEHLISGWINAWRNEPNNIDHFMLKTAISDGSFMVTLMDETVLGQYTNDLAPYLVRVPMSQYYRDFYAYNPRLFAMDIYGIPELWYYVLYANEMTSMLEFNVPVVKFYSAASLTLLRSIRELQKPYLDENEQWLHDIRVGGKSINDGLKVEFTFSTS